MTHERTGTRPATAGPEANSATKPKGSRVKSGGPVGGETRSVSAARHKVSPATAGPEANSATKPKGPRVKSGGPVGGVVPLGTTTVRHKVSVKASAFRETAKSSIFLSGGNHWDERWVIQQALIPGESIPIQSQRRPGGAAANMCRALIADGHDCTFASVYGQDTPPLTGPYVRQICGENTPRYTSIEDKSGKVLYGLADMELYERGMTADWYRSLIPVAKDADVVVIDCNGPDGVLAHVGWFDFMVGLAVSPAKVCRLRPILDRLQILFCNAAEVKALGADLAKVAQAVVTQGPKGAHLLHWGTCIATFPAPDWTPPSGNGLGDRLAGLTLSRVLAGSPLDQALPDALEALPC